MTRTTCERTGTMGCLPLAMLMLLFLAPPAAFAGPEEVILAVYPALERGEHRRIIDIGSLLRKMEHAYRTSDLAAAAALIDFPLVLMTTGPDGRALDVSLGPEEWLGAVESLFDGQPRERTGRTSPIVLVTDSLAWFADDGTTVARPSSTEGGEHPVVVVRKHGKWLVKAIVEELARLRQLTAPDGSPCDR